ncbi:TIM21-domain-containing protein [Choiromyces venosus 120613-1]|uniref:Mitochondrial import inner membrane translocase subunit Tim21 n=1 Tax=Choiromyces venosus 120613-1 TaxID=1336337 RepID=A0A3N4JZD1_9PEZI|nr:TIM21-domain-containing protein [Choiromyces venosus 120613-1]
MSVQLSTPVRSITSRPGIRAIRASSSLIHAHHRPFSGTKASSEKRKIALTPGSASSKKWGELSKGQKVVRTASTGANFVTIVVGVVLTGTVLTLLFTEVFAPNSIPNWFNSIHNRIKTDSRCTKLLGERIKAYGEPTSNRWARNRPIASSIRKDRHGIEHLIMHFNVEGTIDKGVVNAHLTKRPGESNYEYKYLFLDVPGKPRVYLENESDRDSGEGGKKKGLFGVQWGW